MVKKTMHELAQEFPEKTYKELEKYRDADRQQEAQQILIKQENEELKEDQHKENWKEKYEKEHKLRQEAEGELTIVKTITIDSSPEMRDAKAQILAAENVQKDLRRDIIKLKKEICELRQDNRKLSKQVEDSVDRMRKAGVI
jgi:hypothetical protein